MRKKGLIDIYILEILEKYADKEHKLSQKQIIFYLEREYRLTLTRKTLSGYLAELRDDGYIEGERGVYKVNKFADNELRLLIDGVLFGQHVPQRNAYGLIQKLKSLSGNSLKNRIKHICYLESINHTPNVKLYEIIDIIDEAIEKNCKVELTICAYMMDGKLYDKATKTVDPYYLVTDRNRYYLICYAGRNNDLENRRVDRISHVTLLSERRRPITDIAKYANGFDLANYMREHIYMFSGDSIWVVVEIRKQNIGDFIDWFGSKFKLLQEKEDTIVVRARVNENAMYYWALQYGEIVEVLKPDKLRERLRHGTEQLLNKYVQNKKDL
ncbi:MAG: WYL domain-containing protein [Acetatifactor sp.]|nr:WYL domain-containing protein [Acetatifactor sp.]